MRKRLVKIISGFLFVVFLAGVIPAEFLHNALFQHHDTEHQLLRKGELVISSKHIHCSFMGFVLAPFIAPDFQVLSFRQSFSYTEAYLFPQYYFLFHTAHKIVSLRGPPATV